MTSPAPVTLLQVPAAYRRLLKKIQEFLDDRQPLYTHAT